MSTAGTVSTATRRDVFVWTLSAAVWQAELKAAKEAGKEKRPRLFSPPFDAGRWRIQVDLFGAGSAEAESCGFYLIPTLPHGESLTIAYRLRIGSEGRAKLRADMSATPYTFKTSGMGWGWASAFRWSLIEGLSMLDNVKVTVTLLEGKPSSSPRIPLAFFNNVKYCDVAFILPAAHSRILAAKPIVTERCAHLRTLLSSDFAEGSADQSLSENELQRIPQDFEVGDFDDFADYAEQDTSLGETEGGGIGAAEDGEEKTEEGKEKTDNGDSAGEVSANEAQAASPGVEPATVAPAGGAINRIRSYHRVEVGECSFTTLFAFLWYLYYDEISFAPSRAIALASPEEFSPSQGALEIKSFLQTGKMSGAPPCDAHAMYRLADRYLLEELRELAKDNIVEELTPETAPYEVFSSLSRTYSEVQIDIIEYILKNVDEVRKSKGWSRSIELLNEGQLIGGAVILNKILDGVVKKEKKA